MFRLHQFFDALDTNGGKLFLLLLAFLICVAIGDADLKKQAFAAFIGAVAMGAALSRKD